MAASATLQRSFLPMKFSPLLATLGACSAALATALGLNLPVVLVGDANNPPDPGTGNLYGSVSYAYSIGKFEVTLGQYGEFLNAVAASDTHGLYDRALGFDEEIVQSGLAGSYQYSVTGDVNRPVAYVTWFDAARFVNWLHNGQPAGLQNAATTEDGAYTLLGANSGIFQRNADARWWIPTENEWYKAAYYDPSPTGPADDYWLYPTRSDTAPRSRNGSATDTNSANFYRDDGLDNGFNGGFAISNSTAQPNIATTLVGAFLAASSYYGTFDQAGNLSEYTGTVTQSQFYVSRGGGWGDTSAGLRSTARPGDGGVSTQPYQGFRVATVPEPSGAVLAGLGAAIFSTRRRRR